MTALLVLLVFILALIASRKQSPQSAPQAQPSEVSEEERYFQQHPLRPVLALSYRIEVLTKEAESLPDLAETLQERRILKEQLRMASFERDLLLSILTGHHPNASVIDTKWCFTSAELSLKFARARLKSISAVSAKREST